MENVIANRAVLRCKLTIVANISPACHCSHLPVYQSLTVRWQTNRLDVLYPQECSSRLKETNTMA